MHPYENLGEKFFWAPAVGRRNMFDIEGMWNPKFRIARTHKIVTFGSCFAQHIGRALDSRGFNWMNTEPAPSGLSQVNAKIYNYGIFSARTGNIYTASLLNQWTRWADGEVSVPSEVWGNKGRYYDPFRPNIEPNGFASKNETLRSREVTIKAFRDGLTTADVFVFTLGLTESWWNKEHGYEYPICPGVVAGDYDEVKHRFINQTYPFILKEFVEAIRRIRKLNPTIRFLLTVSPVPLTATMSGNHVLVATMESKSILRAVASQLARKFVFVDYFPSYEIINATPFRGTFFESNQRNVNNMGVDHVMNSFFRCLNTKFPIKTNSKKRFKKKHSGVTSTTSDDDVVCEEELLNAFTK